MNRRVYALLLASALYIPAATAHADAASAIAAGAANGAESAAQSTGANASPASPANSPSAPTVAEVVVTAQRRVEKMQNVPVAVTALGSAQLQSQGVTDTTDLNTVVPGLNFTTGPGVYGLPVIRSVGTTSQGPGIENPVATYIDGVYMVAASSSLTSLNDIDQVAVLKGPQGTLFGRNAVGGLIQVTTKTPSYEPHMDFEGTVGNVGTYREDLYLTGGLTQNLAANFAVLNDDQFEGFGRNLATGQWVDTHRTVAMRGKLRWQPDSDTDVTLSADYSRTVASTPDYHMINNNVLGQPMPGGPFDTNLNVQPYAFSEQAGVSLTAKHNFSDLVQVASITAYRNDRTDVRFDADGTPLPLLSIDQHQGDRQFSQELQFLSIGDHRFNWTAGLFFMSADSKYDPALTIPGSSPGPIVLHSDLPLTSYAAFAQGTYKINDTTNLTVGLRYSDDDRRIRANQVLEIPFVGAVPTNAPADTGKTFAEPTWRLSLDHRFSSEVMGYISYNRGFRSGTYAPQIFPATPLKAEVMDAFEAGLKTDLFNRRLRFNAAAFYYDDHNRQVLAIINGFQQVFDAEEAISYGMDADLTWQATRNLSFIAGVSTIHAYYSKFTQAPFSTLASPGGDNIFLASATGKELESTPDFTLNIGPSYRFQTAAGEFKTSLNYYHNSGWWAGPDDRARQSAYDTLGADVLWTPSFTKNLTLRFWGKNLTNAIYATQLTETAFGDNASYAPGRTYGVTLGVKY